MKRPLHPALFVTLAALAFATSGPLSRFARPTHPLVVAFGRVALAGLVLVAFDVGATTRALRALSRENARLVVVAGGLLALHFALFLWGLDLTSLPGDRARLPRAALGRRVRLAARGRAAPAGARRRAGRDGRRGGGGLRAAAPASTGCSATSSCWARSRCTGST